MDPASVDDLSDAFASTAEFKRPPAPLKGKFDGLIISSRGSMPILCSITYCSPNGARVMVEGAGLLDVVVAQLPARINLLFTALGLQADCRIVWRAGKHFGVGYLVRPRRTNFSVPN